MRCIGKKVTVYMNMEQSLFSSAASGARRTQKPSVLAGKLISFAALLVCCALLTVFRCFQLTAGRGETLCAVLTACAFALMTVLAILSRRRLSPELRSGLASVTFGAAMAAFLLLTAVAVSVYFARYASTPVTDENAVVSFLMKASAVLSAAYFLIASASVTLSRHKAVHLLLAMTPIFFCALRILNTFINNSTMPLAESGGYRILGMIAAMLFFLNEGKLLIGVKTASAYLVTGYAAVLLCAAYDLPMLITGVRQGASGPDAVYSLLTVGMVLYMLPRLATLPARKGN